MSAGEAVSPVSSARPKALLEHRMAASTAERRCALPWRPTRGGEGVRGFSEAAELARRSQHPYPLALALVGLARVAQEVGDAEGAKAGFEAALDVVRRHGLAYLLAPCLCALAGLARDPLGVRSLVREAWTVAQCGSDRIGEALALEQLARQSRARTDMRGAVAQHREALLLRAGVGDPAATADSLDALAGLAAAGSDFTTGARLVGAADAMRHHHECVRPAFRQDEYARTVASVRHGLGQEAFDAKRARGAAMSTRAAVSFAVRHVRRRGPRQRRGWEALTRQERVVATLVAEG